MAAKTFYGSVDPALALKVLQKQSAPRPTLKGAFTAKPPSTLEPTEQPQPKKTTREKQCTGHFGCSNLAVFKEASGTLYCRDHKPKSVPVANVFVAKKKQTKRK